MTLRSQDQTPALSWAAFLGASWTWCIGMFLPVLLIRDYGVWVWVIFAVPNCVGAAAMGWVMRSPEHSRAYVRDHAAACRWFSLVTIAFQVFFAFWMLLHLVDAAGFIGIAVILLAACIDIRPRARVLIAPLILSASVIVVLWMGTRSALVLPQAKSFAPADIVGLSIVCLAGFLTCPYLDLTFHRARQHTTKIGSKIAFGIGFCGHFLLMIAFTLFYATNFYRFAGLTACLLAVHYTVQLAYTVSLHRMELIDGSAPQERGLSRSIIGVTLLIAIICGVIAHIADHNAITYQNFAVGEVIYRVFMAFYGLVFPAYVILSLGRSTSRAPLVVWISAIVLASPFYWLAFINGQMAWTTAGIAVIAVVAILTHPLTRPARSGLSE